MTNASGFGVWTTRADALARLAGKLRNSGIEDPLREARLLLCAACGVPPAALIVESEAPLEAAVRTVEEFASRRAAGEPLSRIVGKREFWDLALTITSDVLDPRPETETIVEISTKLLLDRRAGALRILDLGVGSGALLCALFREFANAQGVGVDISAGAVEVARENVDACGFTQRVEIRVGDWATGLEGRFDLVVSNPPYVRSGDLAGLPREVREFDPRLALDGGADGVDAYRQILPQAKPLLSAGGWLLLEVGAGQAPDVLMIAEKVGFSDLRIYQDLAGFDRVVVARN